MWSSLVLAWYCSTGSQGCSSIVTGKYRINWTFTFERVVIKPEVDPIPNLDLVILSCI